MRLYGLIGYPLSHSFSKKYFDEKFISEGITNAAFQNFALENISDSMRTGTTYQCLADGKSGDGPQTGEVNDCVAGSNYVQYKDSLNNTITYK